MGVAIASPFYELMPASGKKGRPRDEGGLVRSQAIMLKRLPDPF